MQTHRALWLGLLAIMLSIGLYFLIGNEATTLALQIVVLGVAVTVSASWFPAAVLAIRAGAKSAGDKITLSVWSAWSVLVLQRIYALGLTAWKRPEWLLDSPISVLITTLICVAGTYAAYATISEAQIPQQDKTWTLISTGIGCFVAGIFTAIVIMGGFHSF